MNQIINKFLLTGDKFMPEMHSKQPGFTYSACGSFTKHQQKIQKFILTGDRNYIYKNELNKACFQHYMAYSRYKDLQRRTQSDKVLKYKAFSITNNQLYNGFERSLTSMVYEFFSKKSEGRRIKNKIKQNQQLANKLHKPIITKVKKRRVYASYKDNIWGVDLADMQ